MNHVWRRIGPAVLVLAALLAPAAAGRGGDGLEAALAELRKGTWSPSGVETVVGELLKSGHVDAAGWWLDAADAAIKSGLLDKGVRSGLNSFRKQWKKESRKQRAGVAKVLARVLQHVSECTRKRNVKEGKRALEVAAACLAYFSDRSMKKRYERAYAKTYRTVGLGGLDPELLARLSATTDALRAEVEQLSRDGIMRAVEEFERYGTWPAFGPLQERLRSMAAAGGRDRMRELVGRARKAARAFRKPDRLAVWFCNVDAVEILHDGRAIATHQGIYREGDGTAMIQRPEGLEGKSIELDVYPGDHVVFGRHDRAGATRVDFAVPSVVLAVHAAIGERKLGAEVWRSSLADKHDATDEAPLAAVHVGKKRRAPRNDPLVDWKTEHVVRFAGGITPSLGGTMMSLPPEVEEWFTEHGADPIWVGTRAPARALVLVVPE